VKRTIPYILLSDGQSLEEYGLVAKIIHIPGRTPGSIGMLTAEDDLFTVYPGHGKPFLMHDYLNAR
jgi:glyoxylase-like metal-dependent hydrolase (beta-lactamase superfamily II)